MADELFGIDFAEEIAEAFDGQLVEGSFVRMTEGVRDPNNLSAGKPKSNPVTHTFQGYTETVEAVYKGGTLVRDASETVSILGASVSPLVVPKIGDVVALSGKQLTLTKLVERDPASALYTFTAEV